MKTCCVLAGGAFEDPWPISVESDACEQVLSMQDYDNIQRTPGTALRGLVLRIWMRNFVCLEDASDYCAIEVIEAREISSG